MIGIRLFYGNEGAEFECSRKIWNTLFHKGDHTGGNGVDGIVFADAHTCSWVNFGTSLTNNDVASRNFSTVGSLNAQALCLRIATVSCRALGEFMCHK